MLRAERLHVSYGGVVALQDCNLEVADGTCVAVLGANGAGKTTLLRTLARAVRQRHGHIVWNGTRIDGWSADRAARAGIALVPEGRRLFPALSVRDNLAVGAAPVSTRVLDAELRRVLTWFPQLEPKLGLAAARLSGGEQQMVAIARTLIRRPRLLLVDELSLGLAPILTRDLYAILTRLVAEGVGVVVVEQYAELAIAAAQHVVVLERGRVAFSGSPGELRAQPDLLETAYLGRDLLIGDRAGTARGDASHARDGRRHPAVAEIRLRVEAPLKRQLERDAREAGMDTSEWLRELVRRSRPGVAASVKEG